jgi:hypothetical protein
MSASVVVAAQKYVPIPGNLTGGSSALLTGRDAVLINGLHGKLGRVHFNAFADLAVSGNSLQTGELHLANSKGTLLVNLEPGTLVKRGKLEQLKVVMIVEQCTGAYTAVEGSAGTATLQLTQSKSPANASNNGAGSIWDTPSRADLALFITSGELMADKALEWGPY